ncbi:MAG: methyltransferase domain-containing protein [Sedimentisphaerales bacterium]|nr:methyltransferase domain-containing protein [Sedimentisphaerales bacterium]
MKQSVLSKFVYLFALILLLASLGQVWAGSARRGIIGDWQLQIDVDDQKLPAVLSLSRNTDDTLKGEWLSFWGITPLREIKYDAGKLSFAMTVRLDEGDTDTTFSGSIQQGELSGVFSNNLGEYPTRGKRIRGIPIAAGTWEMKLKMGDREFTADLIIQMDDQGKLSADWNSQYGEHEITNVEFRQGKLTFDRKSTFQDRQWESSFEGTLKNHTLSGMIKSERGDIALEGKRVGAAAIGQWELDVRSDSWTRKELLRVFPDLSARYGAISIEKVHLDGKGITFKTSLAIGSETLDISFAGQINDRKLAGEITSSAGLAKVMGEKRRLTRAGSPKPRIMKTPREPDVIYVPTPQPVVDKMLELAQVTKDDLVYDLGCGDGRIVVTAAKKYGCKAVGFDIARKRIIESLENVEKNNVGHLVRIEQKDIFTLDLSKANVITLYLLPELNVKLIPQLEKLKPGSRIVSHDFDMRGVKPDKVVEDSVDDEYHEQHTIYLWTTPLNKVDVSDDDGVYDP